jgi:thymidylate synthase
MNRLPFFIMTVCIALIAAKPAWAIKQFQDQFLKIYTGEDANEEFKSLANEAKCNICHVQKEDKKKVRNIYGKSLQEWLEKEDFPIADFKKDQEKYVEQLKKIFVAIEAVESGDKQHKTFGDRMKANLLPGGDKDGK